MGGRECRDNFTRATRPHSPPGKLSIKVIGQGMEAPLDDIGYFMEFMAGWPSPTTRASPQSLR